MLVNNNISPLCFYDDINLQNHRRDYAYGAIYPLVVHRNNLMPFQAILHSDIVLTSLDYVKLYSINSIDEAVDITESLYEGGMALYNYESFSLLKYKGNFQIPEIKYEGQYYLKVAFDEAEYGDTRTYYSEVFTVKNNVDDFIYLEYGNPYNFELTGGLIDFSDNFKFKCYLPTQVGKPEYSYEEEAVTRMGYTFMKSQVSKKTYKFTAIMPEYLCDALRVVSLCADRQIISNKQIYRPLTFSMDVEWEEQGDLASVECEFETDNIISNIGGYRQEPLGGSFDVAFSNAFEGQTKDGSSTRNRESIIENNKN